MTKKRHMWGYNREAPSYDITRGFYEKGYAGRRERELLSPFLHTKYIVLDLACGTGRLLPFLAKECSEVIGLDFSRGMLAISKRKSRSFRNIHLVLGDAENLPFRTGVFDAIVCSRAFKFFPNPIKALVEGGRSLKPKGKYALSLETSDPTWIKIALFLGLPGKGARSEWRYRKNEVLNYFKKAGFKIIFSTCLIYFGRSIYEITEKFHLRLIHKVLRLIDTHSLIGRNILIVGERNIS